MVPSEPLSGEPIRYLLRRKFSQCQRSFERLDFSKNGLDLGEVRVACSQQLLGSLQELHLTFLDHSELKHLSSLHHGKQRHEIHVQFPRNLSNLRPSTEGENNFQKCSDLTQLCLCREVHDTHHAIT